MSISANSIIKKIMPVALGASAGYLYWHFIGCSSGSCPLTSQWFTSTLYGALVGATFLLPGKKLAPRDGSTDGTSADKSA